MMNILMLTDLPSGDFTKKDFAGLSLRVWEIARIFASIAHVDIAAAGGKNHDVGNNIHLIPSEQFHAFIPEGTYDWVYLLLSTKHSSLSFRLAQQRLSLPTIVDCYTPALYEKVTHVEQSRRPSYRLLEGTEVMSAILRCATVCLCASDSQRDFLYGVLLGFARNVSPTIICVRTGVRVRKTFRPRRWNNHLVWFGGVYPWMDIVPVLRSFESCVLRGIPLTLHIVGGTFKEELGFRNDWKDALRSLSQASQDRIRVNGWVPFSRIPIALRHASLAVSWARRTTEDRLAYRSRFLSTFIEGIPLITNGDDEISRMIPSFGAGARVDSELALQRTFEQISSHPALIQTMSRRTRVLLSYFERENQMAIVRLMDVLSTTPVVRALVPSLTDKVRFFLATNIRR